jgi:hypothetical protein
MRTWGLLPTRVRALMAGLAASAGLTLIAVAPASANDAYEPNEMGSQAAGPLALNQTIVAKARADDIDYYKFYVAKTGTISFEITAPIPDDCGKLCAVTAFITDEQVNGPRINHVTIMGTQTISGTLPPGRYFLIIRSADTYLDPPNPTTEYTIKPTAGIATWAQMKAACNAAKKPTKQLQKKVSKAKLALARAKKKGKGVAKAKRALNQAKKKLATAQAKSKICSIKP